MHENVKRFAAAALVACVALGAVAQEKYPSRAVEVIVPWGPGGGADVLGRLVAKWLEREFKTAFPVMNAPGATGSIGIGRMVQQGSDAHTIAVLTGDTLALAAMPSPQLKPNEITALGIMIRQPSGLFAKGDGPFKSWEDVVAAAKAKPGTISVAITGANSPDELTVNYLGTKGISLVNIGYTKPGERYTAVIGGHVTLLYEQAGDIKGQLESKALRPLIFFATQRLPAPFSDIPVSSEFGYDILLPQMRAIIAHAGAPPDRLATLSASLDRFAATPEFQAYLRDQYALPDSYLPRREAQRFLEGEVDAIRRLLAGK